MNTTSIPSNSLRPGPAPTRPTIKPDQSSTNLSPLARALEKDCLAPMKSAPRTDAIQAFRESQSEKAYDEMVDQHGHVRPQYRAAEAVLSRLTPQMRATALEASKVYFEDENALAPVPRILLPSELRCLRTGVAQRGAALRAFLKDHYRGSKTYRDIISEDRVNGMIARSHESGFAGLIDPEAISFSYGPDVARCSDGRFYVIEDNLGYTGGPADLIVAREAFFGTVPQYQSVLSPQTPAISYFHNLIEQARKAAIPADGKIVVYAPIQVDRDDRRLSKVFVEVGAELVTHETAKQLYADDRGVFLKSTGSDGQTVLEPVGYIFLKGEHRWLDASHPATYRALIQSWADNTISKLPASDPLHQELLQHLNPGNGREVALEPLAKRLIEKEILLPNTVENCSRCPNLVQAILTRKVGTDYCPGVDFVGNKDFKGYVDDLIRFYLKQEPIIPNIPTQTFIRNVNGEEHTDHQAIERLLSPEECPKWVFKASRGRGGKGVYIGPKMTPADLAALRERVELDPSGWIAEPFVHLSKLDGHLVDLRVVAMVHPNDVTVASVPWARGVPLEGDGKVNLSQHGKEFAVFIHSDR